MTQTAHTPGPWRIQHGSYLMADRPSSPTLPLFLADIRTPIDNGPQYDMQHANARLIAAAPDLLAALEAMVLNMRNDRGEYRDCFKAAERAIAKAKGE